MPGPPGVHTPEGHGTHPARRWLQPQTHGSPREALRNAQDAAQPPWSARLPTLGFTDSQGVLRTAEDGDRLRGHGQREPRGRAARLPPQRSEREAEARGALSKAPRRRPAPVAPRRARWPARAGTPETTGAEPERSWPRTGPGEQPERERSPKGRAAGRPAGLGGRKRGRERCGAGGRRAGGRTGGRERSGAGRASGAERGDRARTAALRGAELRRAETAGAEC